MSTPLSPSGQDPGASAQGDGASPTACLAGAVPAARRIAPQLERLGIRTVADALFFFPRDYQDYTDRRTINQLEPNRIQSVVGVIEDVELKHLSEGRSVLGALVSDTTGLLRAVWFNQPYLVQRLVRGQPVLLSGRVQQYLNRWEMHHPQVASAVGDQGPNGSLVPVYPQTEGLRQHQIRRLVECVVRSSAAQVEEVFAAELLARYRLMPIAEAIRAIHRPADRGEAAAARRRFVFQELYLLQLALALRRQSLRTLRRAPELLVDARIDARIRRLFPFELTEAQNKAIRSICDDLAKPYPMNRLLQGDVGSGKTVPAVYAMLACVARGHQAVLMAPTEVLARQHLQTFAAYLSAARVRRALLAGGLDRREREETLAGIESGQIDLVIGTHAVLERDVRFARLGLVVIDEQHKFGVRQRAQLRQAGVDPHYLVMTATPIPRSLSMSLFGDLDRSLLREKPPGRQPVSTYLVADALRGRWWDFVRKKLEEGRQAYVIAPLVEESASIEAGSAESLFESLANGPLEAFRLGLIHGRMTSGEKDAAMTAFRQASTQVLVSTTVIEVGVDVPNATVMTIDGAERFGLAQLHQLRGRVARGRFPGFCGVLAAPRSDEARMRLDAFARTDDGFELAEIDFQLRGPGNLLGTEQHGLASFRLADLARDTQELEEARTEALKLVDEDPGLMQPRHAALRRKVLARYGSRLELGDAG